LTPEDAQNLCQEAKLISLDHSGKIAWLLSIFGPRCPCKKKRGGERLRKKAFEHFDHQLDIRSLAATSINFKTLIHLMFNRKQMLLFRHQHERAVTNDEDELGNEVGGGSEIVQAFSESLLKFNLVGSMAAAEKQKSAFNELVGFKVDSELSRKLLLGVFESKNLHHDDHDELEAFPEENENVDA